MVRGHCPDCERLVEITTTGQRIGVFGTACWWKLVLHSDGKGGLCPGSGKMI